MIESKVRVLVVENHTLVRKGLCALLEAERYGCEIVGEAADGQEAVTQVAALAPDVTLMDLLIPNNGGIEATYEICQRDPRARVLILASFYEPARVRMALKVGALGYVLKDVSPDELVHAIHSAYRYWVSVPSASTPTMLAQSTPVTLPLPGELTARELDVLRCVAGGLADQEIAAALSIGVTTVRTHVRNILGKLHFNNRTQAATYAVELGLGRPGRS